MANPRPQPAPADLVTPLTREEVNAASERINSAAIRTPLLSYQGESAARAIWLKPENLQPYGSFKIRSATNAIKSAGVGALQNGVATGSAGNFGQGLAFAAKSMGVACSVHAPTTAARTKIAALKALGAVVTEHSFDGWWKILSTRNSGTDDGAFIHPVAERAVMAGNATIGFEILEDLPDTDVIYIPFGGGGLSCGVSMAAKMIRPSIKIVAVETEAATPLKAAFEAGAPVTVEKSERTFVDGAGSTRVLDEMWPLLRREIDEVVVVSTDEVAEAVYDLANAHHMIVEGAGAAALAAAKKFAQGDQYAVALLSGGNLDHAVLTDILRSGGKWQAP